MNELTQEEWASICGWLRAGEEVLWAGRGNRGGQADDASAVAGRKPSWWQRLCGRAERADVPATPPAAVARESVYVLLPTRVLELQGGCLQQEWMLMLGMVQKVESHPDGSGNIVFDYEESATGEKQPRGLLGIENVATVRDCLHAAIDAAYMASPWT